MDVHAPSGITRALRRRGVDVLTAQEDGASRFSDPDLLDRATELNRIVSPETPIFSRKAFDDNESACPLHQ
jgi:hypothetical protein